MRDIFRILLAVALGWSLHAYATPQSASVSRITPQAQPDRAQLAMFDESLDWARSRAATDRIIARLVATGVTIYVPCVWHGRGSYYPSPLTPPDARIAARLAKGEDPLQYLLDEAHRNGIEVHAWFTVVKREDDARPQFYAAGSPKGAYDIHIPEFRDFAVQLIVDTAKRYDLDGINLDYIRSMGLCTSKPCITSYKDQTGSDLLPDLKLRYMPAVRSRLVTWNQTAVLDIVQRIRSGIDGSIVLSVDAHPMNRHSQLQGQFPVKWANAGLIDRIYDMRYEEDPGFDDIGKVRRALNNPEQLAVLLSNAERTNGVWQSRSAKLLRSQITGLHSRWPKIQIGIWHLPRMTSDQQSVLEAIYRP